MKPFSNPSTAEKYRQLGFSPADLSVRLAIGDVSIHVVEHPYKGVGLIFESITPRTMCQYEVSLPERCSVEQIACLIYVNVVQNFRGSAEMYRAHFQNGTSAISINNALDATPVIQETCSPENLISPAIGTMSGFDLEHTHAS